MLEIKKPRDVQILPVSSEITIVRSRTWDRLKFEVEYSLAKGTTANSYLVTGEKIALIDPPGESFTESYLKRLQEHLDLSRIDYVILGHFNPNRAATLKALRQQAPQVTFVCSKAATLAMQKVWENEEFKVKTLVRGENSLDLGNGRVLQFIPTPTPRWPDGICTYDPQSQILFTDKFFGAHICGDQVFDEGWSTLSEDRRFYFDSLHASQARQVITALDRMADLPVRFYAPAHGPLVRYGLSELTHLYRHWCQQQKDQDLTVAMLYASAYGNTATLTDAIAKGLTRAGVNVELMDCESVETTEIQEAAQKCQGIIFGTPTLGGHAPTQIQTALGLILSNADKNKLMGVYGSYGWSGEAIDFVESKLKDAGYRLGFDPIRVKFKPTDVTLQECEEAGIDFAQTLKKMYRLRAPAPSTSTIESDRTAQAVGRVVGSLCVVSARRGDVHSAMLASWVSQATFSPPGLTIAVAKDRAIESLMHKGDRFVLNILPEGMLMWKQFVKNYAPGEDRFTGMQTTEAKNGCQILTESLAYLECAVQDRMECGDHWLVYAAVEDGKVINEGVTAVHKRKSGSHY
ncbi:MAG: diflavin flavoprotein [Desertifilum sp.]|nr:diflavin flavoprotein [Desertifilum sp.]